MQYMRSVPPAGEPLDLIDLKFVPAWVKEDWSAPRNAEWEEEQEPWPRGGERRGDHPPPHPRREQRNRDRRDRRSREEHRMPDRRDGKRSRDFPARGEAPAPPLSPPLDVYFIPQAAAFENVAAQIKSGTIAYSVYALARLFLQKPERYHVRVKTKDARSLFRLGESNAVSTNRIALEDSAFRLMREKFYETKVTLNDPIKGDFSSVARERTTGALLGPTNHHSYQPKLRRLYEQHFSRRMSFLDFQRQIDDEGRSRPETALDPHRSTHHLAEAPTNRQAKPTTLCVETVKGFENPLLLPIWYPGSMVNNPYTQKVMRIFGQNNIFIPGNDGINGDNNLSIFRTMVYGVFKQTIQNSFDLNIIKISHWQLRLKICMHGMTS